MRNSREGTRKRQIGWLLGFVTLLAGCATATSPAKETATLPPAKAIQDVKSIAGTWAGTLVTPRTSTSYRLTIHEDGSWDAVAPGIPPGKFNGIMRVSGDKALFRSYTTGRTGTMTLHEAEGKRVLVLSTEDGVRGELTPNQ